MAALTILLRISFVASRGKHVKENKETTWEIPTNNLAVSLPTKNFVITNMVEEADVSKSSKAQLLQLLSEWPAVCTDQLRHIKMITHRIYTFDGIPGSKKACPVLVHKQTKSFAFLRASCPTAHIKKEGCHVDLNSRLSSSLWESERSTDKVTYIATS